MDADVVRLRPGETLFTEGSVGIHLYAVRSGRVEVWRTRGAGREVLCELGPGAILGEHGMLRGLPRTATVTALDDTELERFDRERLQARLRTDPLFAIRLLERLAELTARLAEEYAATSPEAAVRLAEIEFEGRQP